MTPDRTPQVEAVVISWRRPGNIARIVAALRRQSVPVVVTVVDAADAEHRLPAEVAAGADRVFRLPANLGPYNRYALTFAYDCEFTYFTDDDCQPGERLVEHFLETARGPAAWSVLGQVGRRLQPDGSYAAIGVPRGDAPTAVDVVVKAYFVRTADLVEVDRFRRELGLGLPLREDDLLLATALQRATGRPCLLTPASGDPETSITREHLPEDGALSGSADHVRLREAFLDRARAAGWASLLAG